MQIAVDSGCILRPLLPLRPSGGTVAFLEEQKCILSRETQNSGPGRFSNKKQVLRAGGEHTLRSPGSSRS